MKLQNGFELAGNISYTTVTLNTKPTQILIIESTIEVEHLRDLFKNNSVITESTENAEIIYTTGGLIDIRTQDTKNYVWLYFISSSTAPSIQALKDDLQKTQEDLQKSQESITSISANVAEFMDYVLSNMPTS